MKRLELAESGAKLAEKLLLVEKEMLERGYSTQVSIIARFFDLCNCYF